jgi:hypothetical protein
MMANLQAIARANLGDRRDGRVAPPAHFVEILAGRFGDNRYSTLFRAEYNAQTSVLTYVNAGHPSPILTGSTGEIGGWIRLVFRSECSRTRNIRLARYGCSREAG